MGGGTVDAPSFGHQHHLQMPLQTERLLGRWEDLGKMKWSSQVLELPPAPAGVQSMELRGSPCRGWSLTLMGCTAGPSCAQAVTED